MDEQYAKMNQTIQKRIQSLQKTRERLSNDMVAKEQEIDAERLIRQAMKDFLHVDTKEARLTREILSLFVENVTVLNNAGDKKELRINYRFAKPASTPM